MCRPRLEIGKYGLRRLRSILKFIAFRGPGYDSLFGERRWSVDQGLETEDKQVVVNVIVEAGIFEFIENRYRGSWERFLIDLVTDKDVVIGICRLMGMDNSVGRGVEDNVVRSLARIQRIVNKLSVIYQFPGDPDHPVSRKRINDIRLNSLFKKNLFGKDLMRVARNVSSFQETLIDPYIRNIFWNCYTPGTGGFKISVNDLLQVMESEDICPICRDDFSFSFPGVHLSPCNHVYHPRCIQHLILGIKSNVVICPMCRQTVINIVPHKS